MQTIINPLLLLAALSMMVIPTISTAQTASDDSKGSRLYTRADQALARQLIHEFGATVVESTATDDSFQMRANDSEGFIFEVIGKICSEGECLGLVFSVTYEMDGMVDYGRLNTTNLRWAAAKIVIDEDDFIVTRYEIMDYGQTYDNLVASLDNTLAIAKASAEYYFSAWDDDDAYDWW